MCVELRPCLFVLKRPYAADKHVKLQLPDHFFSNWLFFRTVSLPPFYSTASCVGRFVLFCEHCSSRVRVLLLFVIVFKYVFYCGPQNVWERDTLRASLSGTFLQKGCRKAVLGVWEREWDRGRHVGCKLCW